MILSANIPEEKKPIIEEQYKTIEKTISETLNTDTLYLDNSCKTKIEDLIHKGYTLKGNPKEIEAYINEKDATNMLKRKIFVFQFEDNNGNHSEVMLTQNSTYIEGSLKKLERKNDYLENKYQNFFECAQNIATQLNTIPYYISSLIPQNATIEQSAEIAENIKTIRNAIISGMCYTGKNGTELYHEMTQRRKNKTYEAYNDCLVQGIYVLDQIEDKETAIKKYTKFLKDAIGYFNEENVKNTTSCLYILMQDKLDEALSKGITHYRKSIENIPEIGLIAEVLDKKAEVAKFIVNNGTVRDMQKFLSVNHLVPFEDGYTMTEGFMPKKIAQIVYDTTKETGNYVDTEYYMSICNSVYKSKNFTEEEKDILQEKIIKHFFNKEYKCKYDLQKMLKESPSDFKQFFLTDNITEKENIDNKMIQQYVEKITNKRIESINQFIEILNKEPLDVSAIMQKKYELTEKGIFIEKSKEANSYTINCLFFNKYSENYEDINSKIPNELIQNLNKKAKEIEEKILTEIKNIKIETLETGVAPILTEQQKKLGIKEITMLFYDKPDLYISCENMNDSISSTPKEREHLEEIRLQPARQEFKENVKYDAETDTYTFKVNGIEFECFNKKGMRNPNDENTIIRKKGTDAIISLHEYERNVMKPNQAVDATEAITRILQSKDAFIKMFQEKSLNEDNIWVYNINLKDFIFDLQTQAENIRLTQAENNTISITN